MPRKLYIKTFGCQMNEYDSAKMADVLARSHGLELAATPEEADVLLLNSCSIREKASEKLFSDLGRWYELKEQRPEMVIGVGGCVASQEGDNILRRAPYVDMVFGPQTLHRLPELIAKKRETGRAQVDISFPEIEKFDHLPPARVEGSSAFVSIMEGCSKYCTFCVVPYTRGEEVSRPLADILAEIGRLGAQGVREITLLGQNVNAYRGSLPTGEGADFALLLTWFNSDRELAGGGYEVETRTITDWPVKRRRTYRARGLVLSGGVLGTVPLLLKCQARRSLSRISPRLSNFVRTNSDLVTTNVNRLADVTLALVQQRSALAELLEVAPAALVFRRFGTAPFDPWSTTYRSVSPVAVFAGVLNERARITMRDEHPLFIWVYPEQLIALSDSDEPLEFLLADGAELLGAPEFDPERAIVRLMDSIQSLIAALGPSAFQFLCEIARLTQPTRVE